MTAPDYFYPNQKSIAAISQSYPAVVMTVTNHNFINGLVVRIVIPVASPNHYFVGPVSDRGMPQINGMVGEVTVLTPTTFSLPIDSTSFDPYIPTLIPKDDEILGQVIPISENALTLTSVTKNNNTIFPEIYGTPPSPYSNYTP
jgi:hypothetical protein